MNSDYLSVFWVILNFLFGFQCTDFFQPILFSEKIKLLKNCLSYLQINYGQCIRNQNSETEPNNLVNIVKVVFQISVRQKDYQISGTKKIH